MTIKTGMSGGKSSKARNPEELMREQIHQMTTGLNEINDQKITGKVKSKLKGKDLNKKSSKTEGKSTESSELSDSEISSNAGLNGFS